MTIICSSLHGIKCCHFTNGKLAKFRIHQNTDIKVTTTCYVVTLTHKNLDIHSRDINLDWNIFFENLNVRAYKMHLVQLWLNQRPLLNTPYRFEADIMVEYAWLPMMITAILYEWKCCFTVTNTRCPISAYKNCFQKGLKIMEVFALFCLELFDLSIEFVYPRKADVIL